MLKKYRGLIIFFYAFCVVMLILGIFFDLDIDKALNSPNNPIAVWFCNTGEIPSRLVCPLAGVILFYLGEKRSTKVIGAVVELGGSAYLGYYTSEYFFTGDYKTVFGIVWGIGFGLVLLFMFKYVKIPEKYKELLKILAVIGILVMAAELLVTSGIKLLWGRVRFRDMLAAGSYDAFTPWYIPNGSNGNNSFPSGHTAGAAMIFLVMLIPLAFDKYKDKMQLCYWVSFAYTMVVGFTRLVMGAHFLSDVAMGAIIGFTCVLIGLKAFESYTKKNNIRVLR